MCTVVMVITLLNLLIFQAGMPAIHCSPIDTRIGNGQTAEPGQFPHLISLRIHADENFTNEHFCGGSILNERWVLTAAHCTFLPAFMYRVVAGAQHVRDDGTAYALRRYIVHDLFDLPNMEYDLTLIELDETLVFGDRVQPIRLHDGWIGAGDAVRVAGWGHIYQDGPQPDNLQFLDGVTLTNKDCASRFPDGTGHGIRDNELCMYSAPQTGVCFGDSGGAAVLDGQVVGVASWSTFPCLMRPTVFVRVSEHLEWINATMGDLA